VSGGRGVPFHCPYCGDGDLRPGEEGHGSWECHACLRVFSLSMLGMLERPTLPTTPSRPTSTEELPR
jgi:transposase-like protein